MWLQNELKSDVARFTTHVQTCLATNQVVAGCENLLQKVESSSTFCNKPLHMLRVLPTHGKLVLQQVKQLPRMVWLPHNLIQSEVSIFT